MSQDKNYLSIISHYEECLERHGDTHLGVDWPKAEDVEVRYRVMLDVIRPEHSAERRAHKLSLLDFGCGASHLYDFIQARNLEYIAYTGLDMSAKFIALSRSKFPANQYLCMDLLAANEELPVFDYILMNGVFTEKKALSFDEMFTYFTRLISKVYESARFGLAFNVMSKQVEWEREDLFHVPFDMLAAFLSRELTRKFVFRNDYGLYEYTTYVYR